MRVAFLGNGFDYSAHFLQVLADHSDLELVTIISPVKGRQRRHWRRLAASLKARLPARSDEEEDFPVSVMRIAHQTGARVVWPDTINDPCLADEIGFDAPEVIVMAGFNEIIKPDILRMMAPILNIHPSLLPAYRGPHPEFWIVAGDERESGVTIHMVEAGIDTGAVVAQERFPVEPWLTGGELQKRAMAVGGRVLVKLLSDFDPVQSPRWKQSGEPSYFSKVKSDDLMVPFDRPSTVAHARSRAAAPWLPLYLCVPTEWWVQPIDPRSTASASRSMAPSLIPIKVQDAAVFTDINEGSPGTVRRMEGGGIVVSCNPGALYFSSAQAPPGLV